MVTLEVIGLTANNSTERSFTPSSSYGTVNRGSYDSTTRTTPLTWIIQAGTVVPRIGTSVDNPDILFRWRSGGATQRITNKVVVTGISEGRLAQTLPIDSSVVKDVNQGYLDPDGIY